jgi:hypothetical protein
MEGSGAGSVLVTNGPWSRRPKNIRILQIRIRMGIRNTSTFTSFFKHKKSWSHKTEEIKDFLNIFAWWWKDPHLWLTDPDADPGGPKTYGSYRSGSEWGSGTLVRLLHSSKIKSHDVTKQKKSMIFIIFWLDDGRIWSQTLTCD